MRNGPRYHKLRGLVEHLNELIDDKWQKVPVADQANESKNAVRNLLDDHTALLEILFYQAQIALEREPHEEDAISFRKNILGNWPENVLEAQGNPRPTRVTCAKILAIILRQGHEYLLKVWDKVLQQLDRHNDEFADRALPFDEARVAGYLGVQLTVPFLSKQDIFCPVDPAKLNVDFYDRVYDLRKLINEEATFTLDCANADEVGNRRPELTDCWSSASDLHEVFARSSQSIKDLYVGLQRLKHNDMQLLDSQYLRRHYDKVMRNADLFHTGVMARQRLFAILICSGIPGHSRDWENFANICVEKPRAADFVASDLHDGSLPLELELARKHFKEESHAFYRAQFRFCPIKLKHGEQSPWIESEMPVFPILEKAYIDKGSFGTVYRVKVAAGYLDNHNDQDMAMKVIASRSHIDDAEWDIAKIVQAFETRPDGLTMPTAFVSTSSAQYYFMELAQCNLETLMGGGDGKSQVVEHSERESRGNCQERMLVDKYASLVPTDLAARQEKLEWMYGLAEGLRALKFRFRPNFIYHGDVKPKNILYTEGSTRPLRISDFGISMVKYMPRQYGQDGTTAALQTQLNLGTLCPNFPPEADGTHTVDDKVDIWGFGVVFAEFVAWISGGPPAVEDLRERKRKVSPQTCGPNCGSLSWYKSQDGIARLNPGIESWFLELMKKHEGEEKFLYEQCWELLRDGLLNCDPKERLDADGLCARLRHLQGWERSQDSRRSLAGVMAQPSTRTAEPYQTGEHRSANGYLQTNEERARSLRTNSTSTEASGFGASDGLCLVPQQTASSASGSSVKVAQSLCMLLEALKERDGQKAAKHIDGNTNLAYRDTYGDTLLHLAVCCEETDATERLLNLPGGFELANRVNKLGWSALHKCARTKVSSSAKHARLILKRDPTIVTKRYRNGKTAYEIAWEFNRNEEITSFLRQAELTR